MRDVQAVLVLPSAAHGCVSDPALRRWLARGQLDYDEPGREILADVVELLGEPAPRAGVAALRFWGQSGERSRSWMAAADPVHLETRMRDARIRHFSPGDIDARELHELVNTLQNQLGGEGRYDFIRIGPHAYVRASEPFDSPPHSSAIVNGQVPDAHAPSGPDAAPFHRLLGEVEMLVHDHAVNDRRAAEGKPVINSFWFWGGGVAPEIESRDLPHLFTGDPLFKGYWASAGAEAHDWNGDLAACLDSSRGRFVAVLPELPSPDSADVLQQVLWNVRENLRRGDLRSVSMLFRDGLRATVRRLDRFRVWRNSNALLERPHG